MITVTGAASSPQDCLFLRRRGSNYLCFPPRIKQVKGSEIGVLAVRCEPGADSILLRSETKLNLKGSPYILTCFPS